MVAVFSAWQNKWPNISSVSISGTVSAEVEQAWFTTTVVQPRSFDDVLVPYKRGSMVSVAIGVITHHYRLGEEIPRLQLAGRKFFDIGTMLVLQQPFLDSRFQYELPWPCTDHDIYQVVADVGFHSGILYESKWFRSG